MLCRASKSPDLAGDLQIFDKIMKISRSPDFECKSPNLLQDPIAVDRQFCHSSRRNDFRFGEFCVKPFSNCVVIEQKYSACGLRPWRQEDAIFVGTPWSHMLCRAWEASLSRCAWPSLIHSIGYPNQRERGLSRDTSSMFILVFFFHTMFDKPQKQMKGFGRKLLSRRRHLSYERVAIGRRKSGILPPVSRSRSSPVPGVVIDFLQNDTTGYR